MRSVAAFVLLAGFPTSASPSDDWRPVLQDLLERSAPLQDWRALVPRSDPPPIADDEEAPEEVDASAPTAPQRVPTHMASPPKR